MKTVVLRSSRCSRPTSSCMSRRISGSSAENGSSKSRISGSLARARARPDPLLHAAAQLVGVGVAQAAEADQLQHLAGPLEPAGLVLALHLEAEGHVVEQAAVGEQAEVLEDHAHLGAPQLAEALRRWPR